MRRHNIECSVGDDEVLLRFDEAHEARKLTGRSDFEDTYTASNSGACKICCAVSDALADGETLKARMEQIEREYLLKALDDHEHNKTRTAKALGLSRYGFLKKLDKYNLRDGDN